MRVEKLGVHDSVAAVFPPERLRDALDEAAADTGTEVAVVADDDLATCDAAVTLEHRETLRDLDWVHSIQSGVDRFPRDEFAAAGVTLTNSRGIHGTSVGQTVAGYCLAFARRLHRHRDRQRERRWERPAWDAAFTLDVETVCVVGLGTLGRGVGERTTAIGMRAVGVRTSADPVPGVDRVYPVGDLERAVADARFVVLAVPLSPATRGLVGPAELAAMPDDAYLVNVARGAVVFQDALVEALRSGDLAGAALDVTDPEPLPEDSPLWEMDEVILTPHCAAYTRDYYRDVADIVATNLRRVAAGEDLTNDVA